MQLGTTLTSFGASSARRARRSACDRASRTTSGNRSGTRSSESTSPPRGGSATGWSTARMRSATAIAGPSTRPATTTRPCATTPGSRLDSPCPAGGQPLLRPPRRGRRPRERRTGRLAPPCGGPQLVAQRASSSHQDGNGGIPLPGRGDRRAGGPGSGASSLGGSSIRRGPRVRRVGAGGARRGSRIGALPVGAEARRRCLTGRQPHRALRRDDEGSALRYATRTQTASISTAIPHGIEAIPQADRAWRPRSSPNTSTMSSENPLTTAA